MKTLRCDFCGEPIAEDDDDGPVYLGDPDEGADERDACGACLRMLERIAAVHKLPAIIARFGWKDGQDVVPAPMGARQMTVREVITSLSELDPDLKVWNDDECGDLGAVVGVTVENDVGVGEPGAVIQQTLTTD